MLNVTLRMTWMLQREAINHTRALLEKRRAERMEVELKRIEAEGRQ